MQVDAETGRLPCRYALRQQRADDARQHIPGAARAHGRIGEGAAGDPAIRSSHDGPGSLEHHDDTPADGCRARALDTLVRVRSDRTTVEASELPGMRCQDAQPDTPLPPLLGGRQRAECGGVDDRGYRHGLRAAPARLLRGTLAGHQAQHQVRGRRPRPQTGPDHQGGVGPGRDGGDGFRDIDDAELGFRKAHRDELRDATRDHRLQRGRHR